MKCTTLFSNLPWNGDFSDDADYLMLDHLPTLHNLTSLACHNMLVQLQPGRGQPGIIKSIAGAPLKALQLDDCQSINQSINQCYTCQLLDANNSTDDDSSSNEDDSSLHEDDGAELALAAALSALPLLDTLTVNHCSFRSARASCHFLSPR
jgi:hypothetical protein